MNKINISELYNFYKELTINNVWISTKKNIGVTIKGVDYIVFYKERPIPKDSSLLSIKESFELKAISDEDIHDKLLRLVKGKK